MSTIRVKVLLAVGRVRCSAKDVEITSAWSVLTILFVVPQAEREMVSHTVLADIATNRHGYPRRRQAKVDLLLLEMEIL